MEEIEYTLTELKVVYGVPSYGWIDIIFYFGRESVYTLRANSAFDCFLQLRRWLESFTDDMAACAFDWDEDGVITTIRYEKVQTPLSAFYQGASLKETVYRFSVVSNRYRSDYRQTFTMFGTARQIVSAFYFPLLRMIMENGLEVSRNWEVPRIEFYANVKSTIVERYLNVREPAVFQPGRADSFIRCIVYMMPDYDTILWCVDDLGPEPAGDCEKIYLADQGIIDVASVKGLWEWYSAYIEYFVFGCGNDAPFNWFDWHEKGIALARQVRKLLPREVDLWYWPPAEDDSGILKHALLIICDRINGYVYGNIDG